MFKRPLGAISGGRYREASASQIDEGRRSRWLPKKYRGVAGGPAGGEFCRVGQRNIAEL